MQKGNVRLLPWVGQKYKIGIKGYHSDGTILYGNESVPGKRLMILGESLYATDNDISDNIFTELINAYINGEYESTSLNRLTKTLTGSPLKLLDSNAKSDIWSHIMFYHYRQTIFKSSSPQNYDTNEQSRNVSAFFEIIKEFSPDFIIALGLRLYHMLPDENVICIKEIENEIGDIIEVICYQINDRPIYLIPMQSIATRIFSATYWNEFLSIVINQNI